jgi:hypothetical protein
MLAGGLSNNTHLNMVVHLHQLVSASINTREQPTQTPKPIPSPLQLNSSPPFLHQPSHTHHHLSACPFPCFTSTSSFSPFPNLTLIPTLVNPVSQSYSLPLNLGAPLGGTYTSDVKGDAAMWEDWPKGVPCNI